MSQNHNKPAKGNFSGLIKIYRNLITAGGMRLAAKYFIECHLFDLQNHTETHRIVEKKDMKVESENFKNSLMYMVSWTSTLRKSFSVTMNMKDLSDFDFVDVGCGKGKATLLARQMKLVGDENTSYIGIDFETNLIEIAEKNSFRMFGDKGRYKACDVTTADWDEFRENLVLYMYNPFDSAVMEVLLDKLGNKNLVVVYVNPKELLTLFDFGFTRYHYNEGSHANLSYAILVKSRFIE